MSQLERLFYDDREGFTPSVLEYGMSTALFNPYTTYHDESAESLFYFDLNMALLLGVTGYKAMSVGGYAATGGFSYWKLVKQAKMTPGVLALYIAMDAPDIIGYDADDVGPNQVDDLRIQRARRSSMSRGDRRFAHAGAHPYVTNSRGERMYYSFNPHLIDGGHS